MATVQQHATLLALYTSFQCTSMPGNAASNAQHYLAPQPIHIPVFSTWFLAQHHLCLSDTAPVWL